MKPPGHLAGSYLVTRLLLKKLSPAPATRPLLLALGTAAGMLPDADTLVHLLRTGSLEFEEDFDHHRWTSHTFPVYLVPGAILYLYGHLSDKPRLKQVTLLVTAGAITHLLQDAIGSGTGLMWAWPLSKRMDGICTLHVKGGRAWLEVYTNHPIAWVERLIILAALVVFVLDLFRR
jgi:membrane-bound metal-dependent hydrolase YbcI (DUF457 family)